MVLTRLLGVAVDPSFLRVVGATSLVGLLLAAVASACSSTSSGTPNGADPDATAGQSDAAPAGPGSCLSPDGGGTYQVFRLKNGLCDGVVRPTEAGMLACRILVDGVDGGCAGNGLCDGTMSDHAAVAANLADAGQPETDGPLCVLPQQSPAMMGPGCSSPTSSGWCYSTNGCEVDASNHCASAACATPGYLAASYTRQGVWLACP